MLKRTLQAILPAVVLAGCTVAPPRGQPGTFRLIQQGQIAPARALAFSACVMDGFDRAHLTLTSVHTRQQRRANGYRIETMVNATALVSVDISDDGRVEMLESTAALMIDTSDERRAFTECVGNEKATQ